MAPAASCRSRWRSWAISSPSSVAVVLPLLVAVLAVTVLSLGYDMTQPLLAGIVTALGGKRGGQAMGLNVFMLFTGFGIGSALFGWALRFDFSGALAAFCTLQFVAALAAIPLFLREAQPRARAS